MEWPIIKVFGIDLVHGFEGENHLAIKQFPNRKVVLPTPAHSLTIDHERGRLGTVGGAEVG